MTKSRRLATKLGRFKERTVCVSTKLLAFGKLSLNLDLLAQQATTRTQKLKTNTHTSKMYVCLSVRPFYLSTFLSVSVHLPIYPYFYTFLIFNSICFCPPIYLSVCLSIMYISVNLAGCLFTYSMCVYLPTSDM